MELMVVMCVVCSWVCFQAAVAGDPDVLTSPSSRIVLGQLPKQGTGAFELLSSF